MQISIVMHFYPKDGGGGAKIIHEYANYLKNNGHNVKIYYQYNENQALVRFHLPPFIRLLAQKFRIEILKFNWFDLDKKIKKIAIREINNQNIKNADVVIATTVETASPVYMLDDEKGKKFYFIQGFENWNCSDDKVIETYKYGMTNIVVSKWLKSLVDEYAISPAMLVSNNINTKVFKNYNLSRRNHSIVFHYREAKYKGAEYAFDTIVKLKNIYSDLSVVVVSIEDKPDNIPSFCEFYYRISPERIAALNNQCQIFMCTSIEEGFGLPGLEAMACGCALVSTSYKGVLEYAIDGENALLSPARDADAMATNIVRLFEDEELRKKIVENGIKTGKEKSLAKSAKEFEAVLINNTFQ